MRDAVPFFCRVKTLLWGRMERVAARIEAEAKMDGARVAEILAGKLHGAAILPVHVRPRADDPPPAGKSDVEILWQAPTLTRILRLR